MEIMFFSPSRPTLILLVFYSAFFFFLKVFYSALLLQIDFLSLEKKEIKFSLICEFGIFCYKIGQLQYLVCKVYIRKELQIWVMMQVFMKLCCKKLCQLAS
jgi:hypothetical protein